MSAMMLTSRGAAAGASSRTNTAAICRLVSSFPGKRARRRTGRRNRSTTSAPSATKTSRASSTASCRSESTPEVTNPSNALTTKILSVMGSRIAPAAVAGPRVRAHQPSSQSVAAAAASSAIRTAVLCSSTNAIASGTRVSEMRLGTWSRADGVLSMRLCRRHRTEEQGGTAVPRNRLAQQQPEQDRGRHRDEQANEPEESAADRECEHDPDRMQANGLANDARAGDRGIDELHNPEDGTGAKQRAEEAAAQQGNDHDGYYTDNEAEVGHEIEDAGDGADETGIGHAQHEEPEPGEHPDERGLDDLAAQEAREQAIVFGHEAEPARAPLFGHEQTDAVRDTIEVAQQIHEEHGCEHDVAEHGEDDDETAPYSRDGAPHACRDHLLPLLHVLRDPLFIQQPHHHFFRQQRDAPRAGTQLLEPGVRGPGRGRQAADEALELLDECGQREHEREHDEAGDRYQEQHDREPAFEAAPLERIDGGIEDVGDDEGQHEGREQSADRLQQPEEERESRGEEQRRVPIAAGIRREQQHEQHVRYER